MELRTGDLRDGASDDAHRRDPRRIGLLAGAVDTIHSLDQTPVRTALVQRTSRSDGVVEYLLEGALAMKRRPRQRLQVNHSEDSLVPPECLEVVHAASDDQSLPR